VAYLVIHLMRKSFLSNLQGVFGGTRPMRAVLSEGYWRFCMGSQANVEGFASFVGSNMWCCR